MAAEDVSGGGVATHFHSLDVDAIAASLNVDASLGLSSNEAAKRLRLGANEIRGEKAPSTITIALGQLRDPMNIMLLAVVAVSFVISQVSTGVMVGLLVVLNVTLGVRQELKAKASVDALSKMQVPHAKVRRDGQLSLVPAVELVPGDVIELEAGDIVPADARIVRSATLETQEAALTGESAPVSKSTTTLPAGDVALGDRSDMVFQNTSVTRGTATAIVVATGMNTQMGQIATMLTSVKRTRSPLQRELDTLTKVLGLIAWVSVAIIVIVGMARGLPGDQVLLLGVTMAISAIPTGMPAFVSGLLAFGAKELAAAKAVVKNLTDVETLGATSAINTDKTGTLTMNEMMVSTMYIGGAWYTVDGQGYSKVGAIRGAAGATTPDFTRLAMGLVLDSDATVSDDGSVVGDPTEAALIVLAAKLGVDAEVTRRANPRLAAVPFDSEYKFMATFHHLTVDNAPRVIELIKGAPDVVLARCTHYRDLTTRQDLPISGASSDINAANEQLGKRGLRVLAFATRDISNPQDPAIAADPMSLTSDLTFVGMVGIIDPLRAEAKGAVEVALRAGIDVRMITGDHAVTAQAIGQTLGLGPGAISGAELQAMSDEELDRRLPELHVFGRVSPQDKLRLARAMQQQGLIVAMTGDAVNDAAALKQADIGVAMGTGSEVTKQAARMILTDDNFGTLVHAVEIGRRIYAKVVAYVRFQMTQLLSMVMLFLAATAFNLNLGMALTPMMIIYLLVFATAVGVVVIAVDPGDPDVMLLPPRDPKVPIANRSAIWWWILYGASLFVVAVIPLAFGPDQPSTVHPSVSLTMTFVVMGLGTAVNAMTNRRSPGSGLETPILKAVGICLVTVGMLILATEANFLRSALLTEPLSGREWLVCMGLAAILGVVVEGSKWVLRRRLPAPPPASVIKTVNSQRIPA